MDKNKKNNVMHKIKVCMVIEDSVVNSLMRAADLNDCGKKVFVDISGFEFKSTKSPKDFFASLPDKCDDKLILIWGHGHAKLYRRNIVWLSTQGRFMLFKDFLKENGIHEFIF